MTILEKAKEMGVPINCDGECEWVCGCPSGHGLSTEEADETFCEGHTCVECYAREYVEPSPTIKDSGERTEFSTGAVRDVQALEKGRCDLLPLDVVAMLIPPHGNRNRVLERIGCFIEDGDSSHLLEALQWFNGIREWDVYTTLLEVAIHFAEGCKKYGERNWQKGIPLSRYVDSAVRHYLKWARGDHDEPHDRAFVWNIMCAIWTCEHKPELNDYAGGADK